MLPSLKDFDEFQRIEIIDMAYQLLNASFDTDEWDDAGLNDALEEVCQQIIPLYVNKINRTAYDTGFPVWDLLSEVFEHVIID